MSRFEERILRGQAWGVRSASSVNNRHFIVRENMVPKLFATREQARKWIKEKFDYIRHRPDLRQPPHNWKMPVAVRVTVVEMEGGE